MNDYILFWLSQYLAQVVYITCVFVIVMLLWSLYYIPHVIKQLRCKHPTYHETMACDAICNRCGKNLGFIQPWRDRDHTRQERLP